MRKRKASARRIRDVACDEPSAIQQESSVREAGEKMRRLETEKFPVADGDKLTGMVEGKFPDRKAAGFGHDPSNVDVRASMTEKKLFCFEHQTIEEARKIMREHGLEHLPVVDGDLHIIGIVTLKDL